MKFSLDNPQGYELPNREMVLFDMKPFYDVDKPFEISRPLKSISHLHDPQYLKKVLKSHINNRVLKKESVSTVQRKRDRLKRTIKNLIEDIDKIDSEAAKHLSVRREQVSNIIEDSNNKYQFYKELRYLFIGFRSGEINSDWLSEFMNSKQRKGTKDALKSLLGKKKPIIEELRKEVKKFQVYEKALRLYDEGKEIMKADRLPKECLDKLEEISEKHSAKGSDWIYERAHNYKECQFEIVDGDRKKIKSWRTLSRRVKEYYPNIHKGTFKQ